MFVSYLSSVKSGSLLLREEDTPVNGSPPCGCCEPKSFMSWSSDVTFSRFRMAFCDDRVRRIIQSTISAANKSTVAANMIHPPHERWETNNRMSTKKAKRVNKKEGMEKTRTNRIKRDELAGPWMCANMEKISKISVSPAATTCTISKFASEFRAFEGRLNLLSILLTSYPTPTSEQCPVLVLQYPKTPNL